jgi:hypothetical protein
MIIRLSTHSSRQRLGVIRLCAYDHGCVQQPVLYLAHEDEVKQFGMVDAQ